MRYEPIFVSKDYYLKHMKPLSQSQGISLILIAFMYSKEFVFVGEYSQEDFKDIASKFGFCRWFLNFSNTESK